MSFLTPAPPTMVVLSLSIVIFFARPRSFRVRLSSFTPSSSATSRPPVRIAMSSSIALRRSPKPGALAAATCSVPRILFTTRVASASPSTSSEMITSESPVLATCSSSGSRSFMPAIFFSCRRMRGFSSSTVMRSGLVTK